MVEFERFDEVLMYIQDFVAKDLSPSVLLLEFANEIKKAEFEQLRAEYCNDVTQSLNKQIQAGRKKVLPEGLAQQNFMKSFFPYHGLNDYYDRLAQSDPKYTEKRELLN